MQAYFRFVDRTHPAFPALLYALVTGAVYLFVGQSTEGGVVRAELSTRQLVGTAALFVLLPAYGLWLIARQRAVLVESLDEIEPIARPDDVSLARARTNRVSPGGWLLIFLLGPLLGLGNNPIFVGQMAGAPHWHPFDLVFLGSATLMWWVLAVVFVWKLPVSRAVSRLGERAAIDLYRLDRLRPIARIASSDALAVAGAMALSPLQSLDAQFRLGNYWPTIVIGLPVFVCLLLVPMWGARKNILRAKAERIGELRSQVDATDRSDVGRLEALTAHLERVRQTPSWPLDFELVSRLLAYVVLPPLAWVAAALVENFIDGL